MLRSGGNYDAIYFVFKLLAHLVHEQLRHARWEEQSDDSFEHALFSPSPAPVSAAPDVPVALTDRATFAEQPLAASPTAPNISGDLGGLESQSARPGLAREDSALSDLEAPVNPLLTLLQGYAV